MSAWQEQSIKSNQPTDPTAEPTQPPQPQSLALHHNVIEPAMTDQLSNRALSRLVLAAGHLRGLEGGWVNPLERDVWMVGGCVGGWV